MGELFKILSIDGGGMRGIIPGQIMEEIEYHFGIKIAEHFDMIAGTSTGGILACAYLTPDPRNPEKPRYKAQEVVDLYFKKGGLIFDKSVFQRIRSVGGMIDEVYPRKGIDKALTEQFGDVWLRDLLKPCVITSYDIERRKGHFFKQHKAKVRPERNFRVKDVARATSAAPTYFECARVISETRDDYTLVDGGIFVNNPSLCAYSEARNFFKKTAKDMAILSVGTGYVKKAYDYHRAKRFGMFQWAKPVIDLMMSGAAEVAEFQLKELFDTISIFDESKKGVEQYLRINGQLPESINPDMDCATEQNNRALREFARDLYHKNEDKIAKFMELTSSPKPASPSVV